MSRNPTTPARSSSAKRVHTPALKAADNVPSKAKTSAGKKAAADRTSVQAVAAAPEKKLKLVRDSFTLPQHDHDLIKRCKKLALEQGRETKKSEVLRAAIQSFALLSLPKQMAAYQKLESIAVGRPKSA